MTVIQFITQYTQGGVVNVTVSVLQPVVQPKPTNKPKPVVSKTVFVQLPGVQVKEPSDFNSTANKAWIRIDVAVHWMPSAKPEHEWLKHLRKLNNVVTWPLSAKRERGRRSPLTNLNNGVTWIPSVKREPENRSPLKNLNYAVTWMPNVRLWRDGRSRFKKPFVGAMRTLNEWSLHDFEKSSTLFVRD
ncbi:hypothetical protein DYB30_008809 [Aphanomyces astaci]|uniref:Uncharacterized protein n=1 Tax=Aphanomyces astaci TaxID=112090 RepID=A0A397CM44_APHAT|nr:hypothetical protein DYB30_008809 [Aphanomyces astaci]